MKSDFSKSGVRLRDKAYLKWIRGCSCVWGAIAGLPAGPCSGDVVPAHGKPHGMGIKGPDAEALPMCFKHHMDEHSGRLIIGKEARDKLVKAMNEAYKKRKVK